MKRQIAFHAGGFGDFLVCFKALFALRNLYPNDNITLFHNGNAISDRDFVRQLRFIDGVIFYTDFFSEIKAFNPDILITTERSEAFYRDLAKLRLKRVITHPHFWAIFLTNFQTPFPYFRGKKHMSEIVLKLVRRIDTKHYNKHIGNINFSQVKECLPLSTHLIGEFFKDFSYSKIIAINAFSSNSESSGINFFPRAWLEIAKELAKSYLEFGFVLLNFTHNPIQFHLAKQTQMNNLKVFVNDESLASLVWISKQFHLLLTVDTGNLHLCDILQIPALVLTSKTVAYRFGGDSYGGLYDKVIFRQQTYRESIKIFLQKARKMLDAIK